MRSVDINLPSAGPPVCISCGLPPVWWIFHYPALLLVYIRPLLLLLIADAGLDLFVPVLTRFLSHCILVSSHLVFVVESAPAHTLTHSISATARLMPCFVYYTPEKTRQLGH